MTDKPVMPELNRWTLTVDEYDEMRGDSMPDVHACTVLYRGKRVKAIKYNGPYYLLEMENGARINVYKQTEIVVEVAS